MISFHVIFYTIFFEKTIFPIIQKNQLIDGYRGKHVATKLLEQAFKSI